MVKYKDILIKLAELHIKHGKERMDFLIQISKYWDIAKKTIDEKETKWLLNGL